MLFCKRVIAQAFHDALETDYTGQPTEAALESVDWLSAHTDWLYWKQPIPPADLRAEFYGSMEWCTRWLDLDPEHVRAHGLPRESRVFGTHERSEIPHIAGLPAVRDHWRAIHEKYLARWAENDGLHLAWSEAQAARQKRHNFVARENEKRKAHEKERREHEAAAPTPAPEVSKPIQVGHHSPAPRRTCQFAFQFSPQLPPAWRVVKIASDGHVRCTPSWSVILGDGQ